METYTFLRHLADSWFLLAMVIFFIAAIAYLWRPGSRSIHHDAAMVPFRNEDAPAASPSPPPHRHPSPEAQQ